ncbi:serine hydrolase domain-containing protein [Mucilaginibacter sp. McL0603]|uniref:serine hydrolase domain-containing protein n=1 Tax=Mucilaginibacter sp. McL0603 TaxID=3415670 RepID=UPI003CEF71BC
MEKKYMRKNKWRFCVLILSGFVLVHSACAQNPPFTGQAYVNEEKAVEKATILLNNGQGLIPLKALGQLNVASIHFSYPYATGFDSLANKYTKVDSFNGMDYVGIKSPDVLDFDTKLYNTLIVQLTDADMANPQIVGFINTNRRSKNVIIAYFGDGSSLPKLDNVTAPIIMSQRSSPVSAYFSAQAIFGGIAITQNLSKTFSQKYRANTGFITTKTRLQYTVPEEVGINSKNLNDIDNIAYEAIRNQATPGCVVLVAKDGKVIFNKAYGYHTYDKAIPDKITDIFDLASVTKISATTIETMRLTEEGRLNLDSTIGTYIPMARKTNKNDIRIRELMEHQAGLIPDIQTYEKLKPTDISIDSSAAYPTKVALHFYLRKNYFKDVMWADMLDSPLKTRGQYVYSDLSMCFMKEIDETVTATPLNEYTQENFYDPLGMQTAGFLPYKRFPQSQIVPTEYDEVFRHSLLDGYVHDPTAALLGGVSGNAGLFSSANDLAILYQMLLNRGTYGGDEYFKPETVDLYTAKQSDVSRRGIGFDRWDPLADHHYPSKLASPKTFGHTGYTGIGVWVDPVYNLVYIFLSNRVNPKVTDQLSSLNIRPRIQDAVYEAIQKGL